MVAIKNNILSRPPLNNTRGEKAACIHVLSPWIRAKTKHTHTHEAPQPGANNICLFFQMSDIEF